jgi:poly(A) polymerase
MRLMKQIEPIIVPRAEHPVSRGMLSPNAVRVLYRLRDNGFIAYLVGGCVRDLLLGREPKDFDVVTDATPGQIKRLFRNCRLVGRRFRLAHLHFADEIVEVATFRSSAPEVPAGDGTEPPADGGRHGPRHLKSEDGMVLRDNLFGTPEQDALRRDFTVNALYYSVADFSLIDYVGGLEDVKSGVIRTIGDPRVRFVEDPVRMLRAVRFAALLGFSIEPETWEAILDLRDGIAQASPPRLFEEVLKLFLLGEGEKSYQLLRRSGLFAALFPHLGYWLDRESDGMPHTWVAAALDRIDGIVQEGGSVTPAVFLSLMFGQYLGVKEERFRSKGAQLQQATDLAVAEFLGETSVTVLIPGRTALQLRSILGCQARLGKMPGRNPGSVLRRPCFKEALDFRRILEDISGGGREISAWWEKFAGENPAPATGEPPEAGRSDAPAVPRKKKRRRRRKKRPGGTEAG